MLSQSMAVQQSIMDPNQHSRHLALYPECAVIQEATDRYACCDLAVSSPSGRDFCYNEIIHEEGVFEDCDLGDTVINAACCDDLSQGNQYWAFDCKEANPGPPPEVEEETNEADEDNEDEGNSEEEMRSGVFWMIVIGGAVGTLFLFILIWKTRFFTRCGCHESPKPQNELPPGGESPTPKSQKSVPKKTVALADLARAE